MFLDSTLMPYCLFGVFNFQHNSSNDYCAMSEYSSGPMLGLLHTGIMRRWWNKLKSTPIGDSRITVYTTFSSQELKS